MKSKKQSVENEITKSRGSSSSNPGRKCTNWTRFH